MVLSRINIEISDRCNKKCWMCGRRRQEKDNPNVVIERGDMPVQLVDKIAMQVPNGMVVQLHNSGEPLLHPELSRCLGYFKHCITGLNTNGILLVEKADSLIGQIDTITISVIQDDDPELATQQRKNIQEFLKLKGDRKPMVILRFLGNVDRRPYNVFKCLQVTRPLHSHAGSFDYDKQVTIPEMGICWDMLNTVAIDRTGKVSHCVRFDPDGLGVIGDLNLASLDEIVNSVESQPWQKGKHLRKRYTDLHVSGQRSEVPLCAACHFYGLPRSSS